MKQGMKLYCAKRRRVLSTISLYLCYNPLYKPHKREATMTYTPIPLEDFLSNAHSPSENDLESFSKHRDKLLLTNENESEEHQKIALIEFLAKSFAYECNTKNRIDLSIYEDNKAKVLFEVKSLNNKAEFINANNGGGGGSNTICTRI